MLRNKKGFTLIELVIVMVIIGIMAAIILPKGIELISEANQAATKAGLGAIRSVVAMKYAKNLAQSSATPYNLTLTTSDFFDNNLPTNKLNILNAVTYLGATPGTTNPASTVYGWWYVTTGTDTEIGRAGAYSDGTINTSTW